MKLTKAKEASGWQGNYMPQDCAEWRVVSHPHIVLRQIGTGWRAVDSSNNNQWVASGYTRADLLVTLKRKLGA